MLDAYSRTVVGWSMAERITTDLVVSALEMALHNRRPDAGVTHHSDQGAQYTAPSFGKQFDKSAVLGSMGAVGSARDNAMAESFFASPQTEPLDRRAWPTRSALKAAVFDHIEAFYNRTRRHSHLDHLSPPEFERRELAQPQVSGAKLLPVHQNG